MSQNEAMIAAFFDMVAEKGLYPAVCEYGTEDCSWWVCGFGDVTPLLPALSGGFVKYLDEGGLRFVPSRIVSGDTGVVVEAVSQSRFRNGEPYSNVYCLCITLAGSKIAGVREYNDSIYGGKVLAPMLEEVFSEGLGSQEPHRIASTRSLSEEGPRAESLQPSRDASSRMPE